MSDGNPITAQPPLYKRDTTGGVRVWTLEIHADGTKYRTVAGVHGGTLVVSDWTQAKPKNLGRANETSAAAQCLSEVESAYKKKRKEGYFDRIEDIDTSVKIDPMLAHGYEDYLEDLPWNQEKDHVVFAQPKLDGIRCIITKDGMFSRKWEPIVSCPHIAEVVVPIAEKFGIAIDGELYNHQLKDDFNEIASLVRKTKDIEKHLDKIVPVIQYHAYDIIIPDGQQCFRERHFQLTGTVMMEINQRQLGDKFYVQPVETYEVTSQHLLDSLYTHFMEQGYEGQMVRFNTAYQHKRTSALLKRKEFKDAEFTIVDVLEGVGNRSGMAGSLVLDLGDGRTFQSNIKGGRDHYRYLLAKKDSFLGKKATIRFFHLTPDGIPRFPVCTDIDRKDA